MVIREMKSNEVEKAVSKYYEKTLKFKKIKSEYERIKAECVGIFDSFFSDMQCDKVIVNVPDDSCDSYDDEASFELKKIQKVSLEFDVDSIEKVLKRNGIKNSSAIVKRYEIKDIENLIKYLKSCGVDPKVFKSHLNVVSQVNVKELENLCDLGYVKESEISEHVISKVGEPFYKVKKIN